MIQTFPTGVRFPNTVARDARSVKGGVERLIAQQYPIKPVTVTRSCAGVEVHPLGSSPCAAAGGQQGFAWFNKGVANLISTSRNRMFTSSVRIGSPSTGSVSIPAPPLKPAPVYYFVDKFGDRYRLRNGVFIDALGTPAAASHAHYFWPSYGVIDEPTIGDGTPALSTGTIGNHINGKLLDDAIADADVDLTQYWLTDWGNGSPSATIGACPAHSSIRTIGTCMPFGGGPGSPSSNGQVVATVHYRLSHYANVTPGGSFALHNPGGGDISWDSGTLRTSADTTITVNYSSGTATSEGYVWIWNTGTGAVTVTFAAGSGGVTNSFQIVVPAPDATRPSDTPFRVVKISIAGLDLSTWSDGTSIWIKPSDVTWAARGLGSSSGLVLTNELPCAVRTSPNANGWTVAVQMRPTLVLRDATTLALVFFDGLRGSDLLSGAPFLYTPPQIIPHADGTWWIAFPNEYDVDMWNIEWNGSALVHTKTVTLAAVTPFADPAPIAIQQT